MYTVIIIIIVIMIIVIVIIITIILHYSVLLLNCFANYLQGTCLLQVQSTLVAQIFHRPPSHLGIQISTRVSLSRSCEN